MPDIANMNIPIITVMMSGISLIEYPTMHAKNSTKKNKLVLISSFFISRSLPFIVVIRQKNT